MLRLIYGVILLNQNKQRYRLFLIILLLTLSVRPHAAPVWYHQLPDSSRTAIRLNAHLLVHMQGMTALGLDSLVRRNIPFAFYAEDISRPELAPQIEQLTGRQKLIPVIFSDEKQALIHTNQKMVLIKSGEFDRFSLDLQPTDSLFNDSLFSFNELLLVDPRPGDFGAGPFFRLWDRCGKLPNFIRTDHSRLSAAAQLVDSLNNTAKFYGRVLSNGELLGKVSWKAFPNRVSNGYFCFPLMPGSQEPFIPHKAGYLFSPDILHDSPANRGYLKEFKAVGLKPDFELSDHFVFDKRAINLRRDHDMEIINNGVKFVTDDERGDVAWFPGRAYLDAGIQSMSGLNPNFSVTAWVKPTQADANNSILGKGRNFVLKLRYGMLTYTMQGIKDYQSQCSKVPVNRWTFISLVHSSYENRIYFYLNGELTEQINLITPYSGSDYTLLIGNNLWEEAFVGYMDEIKIWDRELNEDEIRRQYTFSASQHSKTNHAFLFWLMIPLAALLAGYLFYLKRREKPFHPKADGFEKPTVPLISAEGEKIYCFGGLKVINRQGTDVSLKFSPKLKQLFVLVLLNSINGQKGISTNKLSGILWPGMSTQSAKNTRGTNIQNLKAALASCPGIRLVFRDKFWFIWLDETCYFDYSDVTNKLELLEKQAVNQAVEQTLPELLAILGLGTLFPNLSESWLDPYISKMSDRIIEMGLKFFDQLDQKQHAACLYELAGVISLNDPLNEPALRKKLQILVRQGKLSLAHTIFGHFVKIYHEMYQEEYPADFKSLTSF